MLKAARGFGALLLTLVAGCSQAPKAVPAPPDRVRLAVPYDPHGLDPHRSDTIASIAVAGHFYDGLVGLDTNLKITPALALSWENPDLYTWRVRLRPGVKFHSGRPLTSRDVVYSFRRVMDDPSLEMSVYTADIAEIAARGPLAVEFKTRRPSSPFLNKIRLVAVVPEGSGAAAFEDREDGSGPYKLLEWKKGASLRLLRKESYWGARPFVREAEFQLASGPAAAGAALRSGAAELVQLASKEMAAGMAGSGAYRIARSDSIFVKYLEFNLAAQNDGAGRPNLFRNKLFRQAIALALDRDALAKQLSSDAVPTVQPIPFFIFGHDPALRAAAPDRARAAELARRAGALPNAPAVMQVRESYAETGRLVEQQLTEAGIPLRVEVIPDEAFFDLRRRGQVLASVSRFGCMSGDASDLLDYVFHSPDRARLLDAATLARFAHPATTDGAEVPDGGSYIEHRRAGLQRVVAMLAEQVVLLPLYEDRDAYAIAKGYAWEPRHDDLVLAAEIQPAAR